MSTPDTSKATKRPILVLLHAFLIMIPAFFITVLAGSAILGTVLRLSNRIYTDTPDIILGAIGFLIVAIIGFAASIGMLRMKRWGWTLAILVTIGFMLYQLYFTFVICSCTPFTRRIHSLLDLMNFFLPYVIGTYLVIWYWRHKPLFT